MSNFNSRKCVRKKLSRLFFLSFSTNFPVPAVLSGRKEKKVSMLLKLSIPGMRAPTLRASYSTFPSRILSEKSQPWTWLVPGFLYETPNSQFLFPLHVTACFCGEGPAFAAFWVRTGLRREKYLYYCHGDGPCALVGPTSRRIRLLTSRVVAKEFFEYFQLSKRS